MATYDHWPLVPLVPSLSFPEQDARHRSILTNMASFCAGAPLLRNGQALRGDELRWVAKLRW